MSQLHQSMEMAGKEFLYKAANAKQVSFKMAGTIKHLELKEVQMIQRLSETYAKERRHKEVLHQTKQQRLEKRELRYDNYYFSSIDNCPPAAVKNVS